MANPAHRGFLTASLTLGALIGSALHPAALRIPSSTNYASSPWSQFAPVPSQAVTVQEMVSDLRENGMPVAAIAEIARVERKTVYSWLERTANPRQEHEDRVAELHGVLREAFSGNYKVLHRVWKTKGSDGMTLRDLLTVENVDLVRLQGKLAEMAVTIGRYARLEASKPTAPKVSRNNPAIDESMVVDIG
jgi:hypothetical protein